MRQTYLDQQGVFFIVLKKVLLDFFCGADGRLTEQLHELY
ncbi:hypothetical protein KR50_10170 [Jeotgalibacillus campisalis]|uniref:Uncharacterized protein n=1 Tax=Jeotgalibacillus campisalis TaxID=220754 RepID=A0A0C2W3D3_9BACL|nr:hypothetical protein KR50_10170 [Jeotgalibacillus campisalis]